MNPQAAIEKALRIAEERRLKAIFYTQSDKQCGVLEPHPGHIYLADSGQYWCRGENSK